MKKIVFLGLFFNFILVHAQEKVVTKNGKEIEVNKDASTTSKGTVRLAGDLGGTADAPTVPGLATKQNLLTNPITGTGTINYLSKFSGTSTLTNSLLFDNGSNVGIGTIDPKARFHIEGATTGSSGASGLGSLMWLKQTATWGFSAPYALWVDGYTYLNGFRINGADGQRSIFNQLSNTELGFGTNGGDITFSSGNGAVRRVYILNSNGNMGIGTATPNTNLEIASGTSGNAGLRFTNLTTANAGSSAFSTLLGVNSTGDVGPAVLSGTSLSGFTDGRIVFGNSTGNLAQSDNLYWDRNSNRLGIGTLTPSRALSFGGTATRYIAMERNSSSSIGGGAGLGFFIDAGGANAGTANVEGGDLTLLSGISTGTAESKIRFYTAKAGSSGSTDNIQTEKMTILGSGNVGIGTTSPVAKLEVASETGGSSGLRFTNLTNSTAGSSTFSRILGVNSTGDVGPATISGSSLSGFTNGQVTFGNSSGNLAQSANLFWDQTNSRLGIFTTSPQNYIDVANPNGGITLRAGNSGAAFTNNQMEFGFQGTTDYAHLIKTRHNNGAIFGNAFDFYVYKFGDPQTTKGGQHVMTLDGRGVGIGTTTPATKLHIGTTDIYTSNQNYTGNSINGGAFNSYTNSTAEGIGLASYTRVLDIISGSQVTGTAGAGLIRFLTNTNAEGATANMTEKMRIHSNGNVGIGTSNPTSKLEVNGAATNSSAYNSGVATAILFMNSHLAYTTASATSAFSLQGMKDGGTYTLAVQGATSGTASFFGSNPSGTLFSFRNINNGPTIAGKHTLYTFIVMGTTVYVYMATGF